MKRCDTCEKRIWLWQKSRPMKRILVDPTKPVDPGALTMKGETVHVHMKCMEMVM